MTTTWGYHTVTVSLLHFPWRQQPDQMSQVLECQQPAQGSGFCLSASIRGGIEKFPLQNIRRPQFRVIPVNWLEEPVEMVQDMVQVCAQRATILLWVDKVHVTSWCLISFSFSSFASPPLGNTTFGKYVFTHCYIRDAVNWAKQCTAFCRYCLHSMFNPIDEICLTFFK